MDLNLKNRVVAGFLKNYKKHSCFISSGTLDTPLIDFINLFINNREKDLEAHRLGGVFRYFIPLFESSSVIDSADSCIPLLIHSSIQPNVP